VCDKMESRPRYRVPDELREALLDFTIAYLLERPANLAEFGLNFFTRLRNERESGGSSSGGSNQNSGALNGGSTDANDEGRTINLDDSVCEWIRKFSHEYMMKVYTVCYPNRPTTSVIDFGVDYCTRLVTAAA